MRRAPLAIAPLIVSLLVVSTCDGGSAAPDSAPDSTTGRVPVTAAPATETPTVSDSSADDATPTPTETSGATGDGRPSTAAENLGLPGVEVSTPTSGGGPQPLLEWAAVDSAEWYVLIVHDPAGGPYWAWEGTSNSIRIGGSSAPSGDGPQLTGAHTWQVMAFDSSGIIAASPATAIAP